MKPDIVLSLVAAAPGSLPVIAAPKCTNASRNRGGARVALPLPTVMRHDATGHDRPG